MDTIDNEVMKTMRTIRIIRTNLKALQKQSTDKLRKLHIEIKKDIPQEYIKYVHEELGNSKYTLDSVPNYLKKCDLYINISLYNIKIHVLLNSRQFVPILLLKRVIKRLYIIAKIHSITKDIVYWFLPIEDKRYFPTQGIQVSPDSINGAYTYPTKNEVFIYRFEDFAKVMMHELLHHSIIESGSVWKDTHIQNFKHYFNISSGTAVLPNESLVELWATYYQLLFVSIEYCIPFKFLYAKECEWAVLQSRRLLKHQKTLNSKEIWAEKTNSFTYIILKTIFLVNLKEFLNIPLPYNTDTLYTFIMNRNNGKSLYSFGDLKKNNGVERGAAAGAAMSMRISLFGDL